MPFSRDRFGAMCVDGVSLAELAQSSGTPSYVYDLDAMAASVRAIRSELRDAPHLVAYAVKANSAGRIMRTFAAEGCGADVVSGAEVLLATLCDISPERIVFSGVAKSDEELDRAILTGPRGIGAVQVESVEEVARVEARARAAGRRARVGIRINPSLDLKGVTHDKIATGHDEAKFGVALGDVARAVDAIERSPHLELVGLATHAGSQFTTPAPYLDAARALFRVTRDLLASGKGRTLVFVDSGGGFGIDYTGTGTVPPASEFVRAVRAEQHAFGLGHLELHLEPGRSLVAPHGVLLSRVIQTKVTDRGRWLMIDAGMNDLMRPALYQARHRIVPVQGPRDAGEDVDWRVVGPVCESTDDFGSHPLPVEAPRLVAILDAGAYGYVMASEYNGRTLPGEVFVAGGRVVGATTRRSGEDWARARAAAGN